MIKSTQPPSRKCSLISLILAILLHGYILFFVKYSLEEEKKISPKLPIKLVNLEELRPPSPPPKAPPPKLPPKLPSPPKVPPKEFIPVEEEPEEEEEETPPVEAESETEPTFYSVFELTKQPRVTIPPEVANRYYPPLAKKAKLEGKVLLECIITAEGKIEEIKIVKKAGFGFEEAAIEMLKDPRVRVTPGELEGKPVAVKVHLPVKFTLSEN